MHPSISTRPRWWQWFTILSLDATSVSLVWQWWFARGMHVPLRKSEAIVLAASVWLAYTADRWIEALRVPTDGLQTQRHRFAAQWRWPVLGVWSVVLITDVFVAFAGLTARELTAGFILLGAVASYLLSHQLYHRHSRWRPPKELCVALLIVSGALLFPSVDLRANPSVVWWSGLHFVALCFVNCLLISRWEREVDVVQGQESLALAPQLRNAFRRVPLLPWLFASEALLVAIVTTLQIFPTRPWTHQYFVSLALAFLFLGLVDRGEKRMGRQAARVLADVVLLTPLFFW